MSGLSNKWKLAEYLEFGDHAVVRHETDGYLVTDTCEVLCATTSSYLVQLAVGADDVNPAFGTHKIIEVDKIKFIFVRLPSP